MVEPESDKGLFDRVRAGDEDAARRFFRIYHPVVARIVRNRPSVRHAEEDLCQMIFARVFTNLDQYSGRVPIGHWISRIAVNTCLTEWKKDRRRELPESDLREDEVSFIGRVADVSIAEREATREAQEVVGQLLDRLEPLDRIIIALLHLDQCSVAETSALTGLPQAVVKIRAFRARRKLHKIIQPLTAKFL